MHRWRGQLFFLKNDPHHNITDFMRGFFLLLCLKTLIFIENRTLCIRKYYSIFFSIVYLYTNFNKRNEYSQKKTSEN